MKNKQSVFLAAAGFVLTLLALFADSLGLGKKGGVPAVQILAAEAGALILLAGVFLFIHGRRGDSSSNPLRGLGDRLLAQPTLTWVVTGFVFAYLLFFIFPTFLNAQAQFQYPSGFFPEREHIGFDIRLTLEHIRVWFTGEREPKYVFPPLTTILFTPLLLLRYPANFHVVSALTLAGYFVLNLFLPLRILSGKNRALVFFVFAVSLFSHGLQFELETGQFYTLSMALAGTAIYIFHKHPAYRIFSYLLFSLAVQLKVVPAVLVVMFVDDWRDWKGIVKRFAALGVFNFALLFLLGPSYFSLFIAHLLDSRATHELEFNHSIYAFAANLAHSASWLEALLYAVFFLCFLTVLAAAYRRNESGFNASLFMACVIGALLLPSISHDYKLTMLTAPFIVFMAAYEARDSLWARAVSILALTAAAFAYSATLFPPTARQGMENALPFLYVVLILTPLLEFIRKKKESL
ncbi:MAG: DUF2029 domain-containing protein [Chloroflexi bacterium]|nr:DUF2029 domain-containing protein [Chloroflexota bacterium]MCA2000615.1 DUF2029 domain-containing protein [Chloroflexota bacterium]